MEIMKRPKYKNILTVCFTNQLIDQWNKSLEESKIISDVYTMQTAPCDLCRYNRISSIEE